MKIKYCSCGRSPLITQTDGENWSVYCSNCECGCSSEEKFKAIDNWNNIFGFRICHCLESSSCLPKNLITSESNLSNREIIEKAKLDCTDKYCVWTMSSTYLQALILFADKNKILDEWKFILHKEDGTQEDKTKNIEYIFKTFSEPLDELFMVEWNEG